jgi:hypothetical protein
MGCSRWGERLPKVAGGNIGNRRNINELEVAHSMASTAEVYSLQKGVS